MEILEKLRQFLLGFPGLQELSVDFTQDGPGNSGLFPGGLTEVERRKDLLGNTYVTYECLFTLYKRLEPGQEARLPPLRAHPPLSGGQDAPHMSGGLHAAGASRSPGAFYIRPVRRRGGLSQGRLFHRPAPSI